MTTLDTAADGGPAAHLAHDIDSSSILAGRDAHLSRPVCQRVGWSEVDIRSVDTARMLAVDAVQRAGNGHPGTAMSLAPVAYLLYQQAMRHDPADPAWMGRDRFVLSCGHSSMTLYAQLFLAGYALELDDIKALRTWGSLTPGHPEVGHTPGVEITTGPLGSGLASAVGMAMAQRRQRALLDPDAPAGESPFDHHVYVLASDGDLMEGVSAEASSLAGHLELGNLVCIYDRNRISIEDDTDITFSEDVAARYAAYGWDVQTVDWRSSGRHGDYVEDVDALWAALQAARDNAATPSLIILESVIAWPAPSKQDTGASHGAALGEAEVAGVREALGFPAGQPFLVEAPVLAHARRARDRGRAAHRQWQDAFDAWADAHPDRAALYARLLARELPAGFEEAIPSFAADEGPAAKGLATRSASGAVLNALADLMPELWGGSCDLADSNNTTMKGQPSFVPSRRQTAMYAGGPGGRTLHFGVREHAMGSILNGIALEGLTRPYGGTFMVFSDYLRPAIRLSALQRLPVVHVLTHDSIGLGEDGPTHQPIEHLASLRAIPGLDVVRPADANETAQAWATILRRGRPTALALTRQTVPVLDRTDRGAASQTARGGYVLVPESRPDELRVILLATGSEVEIAVAAAAALEADGIATRVVSMPCREWFAEQSLEYRAGVLPRHVRARVSVEAGVAQGWHDLVGDAGRCVSIETFGASADYHTLYEKFGITSEAVVAAARACLAELAGADREDR